MSRGKRHHTPSMLEAARLGFSAMTVAYLPCETGIMQKTIADLQRAGKLYRVVDTPDGKEIWTLTAKPKGYSKFDGVETLRKVVA